MVELNKMKIYTGDIRSVNVWGKSDEIVICIGLSPDSMLPPSIYKHRKPCLNAMQQILLVE